MQRIPLSPTPADPGSNVYSTDSAPINLEELIPTGTREATLWYRKILHAESEGVDVLKIVGAPTQEALSDASFSNWQGQDLAGMDGAAIDLVAGMGGDQVWACVVLGANYPWMRIHIESDHAEDAFEFLLVV